MENRLMKYNPAFLTEDELIQSFVVRQKTLEQILEIIHNNTVDSNQHILIVGPRGIGKTTLALRVAAEIRRDIVLSQQWYPLPFGEESYMVASSGEFWLEALLHVAEKTNDDIWYDIYEDIKKEQNDNYLLERALAKLLDFADQQGKRLLLIVENFNMLISDQLDDREAWKLRHTFINEPRIMLLASATSRLDEIENIHNAFFELFDTHKLEPLNQEECSLLWKSTTGQSIQDKRIRPIQILTGGNPRLISILSAFGARLSFTELTDDLVQLVDEHTEYFKSHLDDMAAQERKVFLALAEIWKPATAKEVSHAARLDINKSSAILKRLVDRGLIIIESTQGRRKWYQVAERMYNIYHIMRRRGSTSNQLKPFIQFMIQFYGLENKKKSNLSNYSNLEPYNHSNKIHSIISMIVDRKIDESLKCLHKYFSSLEPQSHSIEDAIQLIVELAAAGAGKEALDILEDSPAARSLEPLIVGLKMLLGEDVKAAYEVKEVAKDVVHRIEEHRRKREIQRRQAALMNKN